MIQEVLSQLGDREVYIYGAGCWGNLFYQYCKGKEIPVAGYIVTDVNSISISNGLPVYGINDYVEKKKNGQIVVCMYYPKSVERTLAENFITDGYSLKYEELLVIVKEMSLRYLPKNSYDLEQKIIYVKGARYVNPFIFDDMYFWEWFMEAIDIIFPTEFHDDSLLNEGPYEYKQARMKQGDVVFDLGSAGGTFAQLALGKGCSVYGFEPSPRNFEYLEHVQKIYGGADWKIYSEAVSNFCGEHDFYTGGESMGYDGFRELDDLKEKVQVNTITLDVFVEREGIEKVDFIKANIEGAERMMLQGAREVIRKYHPILSMRTNHDPDDPKILEGLIKEIDDSYVVIQCWRNLYAW